MSLKVDIRKKFKGFNLNISFKAKNEHLGLLGASGSGKSMTLKCIAGVETPDEGYIELNDRVLFDSTRKINLKPQDRNVGYLFQNYALFPNMSVRENIGAGLKLPKNEKNQKVDEMIDAFHLQGLENKYPSQISGGQQQRVALARCIVYKPDILMLDEPFSALDSHLREQLQNGVLELLKLYDGDVIMVSHSMDEIYRFCKKLIIIDKGTSVLFGDTKEIFQQPKLHSAARLTGCKNISKCEVLSSHFVHAVDWNTTLETEKVVSEKIKYIGIRAHDFQIVDAVTAKEQKNVIECNIKKIVEDVFEYNIFFDNIENNKKSDTENLLYKIKKEEWDNREHKESLYLKVPENEILLLE